MSDYICMRMTYARHLVKSADTHPDPDTETWNSGLIVLLVLCCSVCVFYGPFYHGALKLDIPILFTTFFL